MAENKKLSMFDFLSLTALMVLTVYEYPTFATAKFHLVFFVVLFGIFWFIPLSLSVAEMASVEGWEEGGVYGWVSNALGTKWGFAAIFFEWFQTTVGLVTMIYFILGALSYVLDWPALDQSPWIKFIGVLIIFWLLTFIQLAGTKKTAQVSQLGFISGILLPSILFLTLSIIYIIQGAPLQIQFGWKELVPNFTKLSTLVVASSFIIAFGGIEASAPHINELKNPAHNYPLVIIILMFLTIFLDGTGGLSVAAVVPQKDLSLSAGVVQAFKSLILHFDSHLSWLVKLIALFIMFGVITEIASWIIGPSRGLYVAAEKGFLPKIFRKLNSNGVPTFILIGQAIIVTMWDAVLTLGGNNNNVSFMAAISLTVVIYLLCYILIFISYLSLIYKYPNKKRSYSVPGGKISKTILAISGLLLSVFAFFISFVTPSSLSSSQGKTYQIVLICSFIFATIIPFIIYLLRKHFGKENPDFEIHHLKSEDVNKFIPPMGRGEYLTQHEIKAKKKDRKG